MSNRQWDIWAWGSGNRSEMWHVTHSLKKWLLQNLANTCQSRNLFFCSLAQYRAKPDHLLEQEYAQWHHWNLVSGGHEWNVWLSALGVGVVTLYWVSSYLLQWFSLPQSIKILKARLNSSPHYANPIGFLGLCSLHIFSMSFLRIEMVPFLSFSPLVSNIVLGT